MTDCMRLVIVSATDSLLLNKSSVGQILSSTAAVNENPSTGIELSLYLLYIFERLAEKMFKLISHTLEKDWTIGCRGPRTVIVLNVDGDVESGGVLPWVELKLIRLDSAFHG
jgi:hypothetical protein